MPKKNSGETTGMTVESVGVETLHLDPSNSRTHSDRNLDSIKASLLRFGQQHPIIVSQKGVVIAGNGRLQAMRSMGWGKCDVVRTALDGSDATAFAIADNRTAELAEWDTDALAQTLAALQNEDDYDHLVAGFTDAEIAALIDESAGDAEIVEDEVPEPPVDPVTKAGDLWILGGHRLLCGDSTKAVDVERLMGGKTAGLCFTSPPYLEQRAYDGADYSLETLLGFIDCAADCCLTICVNLGIARKDGAWVTYWDDYTARAIACGLKLVSWNIWDRGQARSMPQHLAMFPIEHEWVFVYSQSASKLKPTVANKNSGLTTGGAVHDGAKSKERTGHKPTRAMRELGTIWRGDVDRSGKHPAAYPVAFPAAYIESFAGLVYDPFMGSGTTLIAAEQLGRKCYGLEISPAYCDVIVKRWENLTGEKAVLDASE